MENQRIGQAQNQKQDSMLALWKIWACKEGLLGASGQEETTGRSHAKSKGGRRTIKFVRRRRKQEKTGRFTSLVD